ncbi:Sip1-related alpha-galactosidase [Pelagicoccus mobilis]|uniref:Raffinose synthase n=1 Tax=Pelagicoccus mobilis TaxID=415221 RepID=A0A934VPZ0_9BACT|nr:Sip1-related alpha-galactosidase [Pelagicoccus mobilis]MBK1875989.1 hypothetical protein [Pelagicoccus mobilis]
MKRLLNMIVCLCVLGTTVLSAESLDLFNKKAGFEILKSYSGTPDREGVLEQYGLKVPAYSQAVYYRGEWWPYGGNRVFGEVLSTKSKEGGIFSILELKDGDYLALLPLCGEQAYAWFAPEGGELKLKLGTKGTAAVDGDLPLVAWARANSPYEAANKVWIQASNAPQIKGYMKMREQKDYPEVFNYLGWCSWEEFKKNISSDLLVGAFKTLEENELPVRYMLVDDGHFSLESLMPKKETFPSGYKPLTDLRNEDGIRWVGMWHALLGDAKGMGAGDPPELAEAMMEMNNGRWIPKPDEASIRAFMNYLLRQSRADDIDFVKVDFCGTLLPYAGGVSVEKVASDYPDTNEDAIGNPSAMATLFSRIYQETVEDQFDGLLNCNWHVPHFIFNSGECVVGRSGPDYKLTVDRARRSIFNNFSSIPWLGQVSWGDHDMFHSTDKLAVRMMAISKALSGGPTYLSDDPEHIVPEEVWPLCYLDGKLPRPLAPGAPLPDDIFMNQDDQRLFRTMAPLPNDSVAVACFNLLGDGKVASPVLGTRITAEHYSAASGMIQPYGGDWDVPKEGLLVYDFQSGKADRLSEEGYPVELAGFGEYLIQLSPIEKGWSVIGRTDKYLAAATVEVSKRSSKRITVTLPESGPFSIWLETGVPFAKGVTFLDKGNGLFVAGLPVKAESLTLTIERR